jgi:peptidoglycan/xylan/chitin deacetylase (PgdA/CDA1 family)
VRPSVSHGRPVGAAAVEYLHGPRTAPAVALTFHGAGDTAIANELLAIFAAHHAKVTVLAVGSWLAASPKIAETIVGSGHELGNHTYNHLDINSLGTGAAQSEISRCKDLLASLIGSGGAYFRPSQTQHATPLVRQLAGKEGYPVCLSYDVDSLDYTDPGPATIRRQVATASAGSIVSLHFGHPGTVSAMPLILDDLRQRGLEPVTASTLLAS